MKKMKKMKKKKPDFLDVKQLLSGMKKQKLILLGQE